MQGELTDLTSRLVAIDSVNPDLVPGGSGETELVRFVATWLEERGLEVERDDLRRGERWNVIGVARGSGGGRSLLLNAHMDTVGVAGMEHPFEPRVEGGRLHGRGAYDMKGSLAAIMLAGARARDLGLRGDVVVAAVADEEVASIGSVALCPKWQTDAAIVAEPTELELAVAHRGFVWLDIESAGRAAHGSRPELGVDAIAKMGRILVGLEGLDRELRANPTHPLLGSGSLHASLIEGGQELSSYPDRCLLRAERRTIPGETAESVEEEFRRVVAEAAASDADVRAEVTATFSREPFDVAEEEAIVQSVRRQAGAVLGRDPRIVGVPFWTDAGLLAQAGVPTVLFGPAGEGAHAVVEWVDLESVERCAEVYLAVAAELCA
ncbi:MAG: ArgE/DapE family deacylase [Actinobacteria bacterium]|nr:ArgE/DapE family deacylase [Actinomycetota bacterium]